MHTGAQGCCSSLACSYIPAILRGLYVRTASSPMCVVIPPALRIYPNQWAPLFSFDGLSSSRSFGQTIAQSLDMRSVVGADGVKPMVSTVLPVFPYRPCRLRFAVVRQI